MRIVPKKTKIKNTIWKSFTISDILISLVIFFIVFILLIKGFLVISLIILLSYIVMFIPTPDGFFYNFIINTLKFILGKKKFDNTNLEEMNKLFLLEEIDEQGVIKFTDNKYAKVLKIGQKNFGIEDIEEQDLDINYFSNALKQLEINQVIDIVKIDRPVNFDSFSNDLFNKIQENKKEPVNKINKIRGNILKERIDYIDNLNNIFKQYVSDYYLILYSNKKSEIEMSTINISSEINKCGLDTKVLNQKEVAVFLKYNNSRNFDEREVDNLKSDELLTWIMPKKIVYASNKYLIDHIEASVFSITDYPLKVKNAWGHNIFNIPDTKVVMRIKPVEKSKAIKRIDNCLSELETKEFLSEKASDYKAANIHKETMLELLDSLQSENESLYDVNITITAYNYMNNINYKKNVKQILLNDNFRSSNMYCKQKEGFINASVNPQSYCQNYERGLNSMTLAAVFPFVRTCVMEDKGILLGKNKNNDYPFIFNIWKRDNLYHNSNAMVIGKSGSGKSFFLKNLIVNEWSNNTRIIICDPEAEYLNLTKNLGGNIIDVGNAKEGRINPFHIYKILTEDGKPAEPMITFNTHLKMLESFFKIVLENASNTIIEFINNLVIKTYEYKGITAKSNFNKLKAKDFPTFTDMLEVLEQQEEQNYLKKDELLLTRLYLQKFVNGRYSDIWNQPSTLEVNSSIINFNFQSLFANKNNIVANAQMRMTRFYVKSIDIGKFKI